MHLQSLSWFRYQVAHCRLNSPPRLRGGAKVTLPIGGLQGGLGLCDGGRPGSCGWRCPWPGRGGGERRSWWKRSVQELPLPIIDVDELYIRRLLEIMQWMTFGCVVAMDQGGRMSPSTSSASSKRTLQVPCRRLPADTKWRSCVA